MAWATDGISLLLASGRDTTLYCLQRKVGTNDFALSVRIAGGYAEGFFPSFLAIADGRQGNASRRFL
jgi:hypothetical protein